MRGPSRHALQVLPDDLSDHLPHVATLFRGQRSKLAPLFGRQAEGYRLDVRVSPGRARSAPYRLSRFAGHSCSLRAYSLAQALGRGLRQRVDRVGFPGDQLIGGNGERLDLLVG